MPAEAVADSNRSSCEELYVEGNSVSGGCLVENMMGEWEFWSPFSYIGSCEVFFDFRVDAGGKLYAVNQDGFGCSSFPREPCTDASGKETYPWPGKVVWVPGVGVKESINMCFQSPTSPGGGSWDEATFTAVWDESDYFTDFIQYGKSKRGLIASAEFHNYDWGEGPEIQQIP